MNGYPPGGTIAGEKNVYYPVRAIPEHSGEDATMGIFDDLNKAMKKVEEEVKKADLDKHLKDLGNGINKAGSDLSKEIDKAGIPAQHQPVVAATPAPSARRTHPGYSRLTAWMKTQYKGKIAAVSDPYKSRLELEQITAEATSGLSPKAKRGFLDYLKSQNYEQLLK